MSGSSETHGENVGISYKKCAPYLSATLVMLESQPQIVAILRQAIVDYLKERARGRNRTSDKLAIKTVKPQTFNSGSVEIGWIHYTEAIQPAWYTGTELNDVRHQVVVIVKKNELGALIFSDPGFRTAIAKEIKKRRQPFDRLKLLTTKQVSDGFVGDRVRTLWLGGAHRRTAIKADSKILTGLDLEAALSPLEDQSYYMSTVRSTHDGAILSVAQPSVIIGANPRNSRVWLGPTNDWQSFIDRVEALINIAAKAIKAPLPRDAPLPILASPVEDLENVSEPYDMAVIVPEEMPGGLEDDGGDRWLHEFADAVRFEIEPKPNSPSFEAEVFWGDEKYGRISYEISASPDSSPAIKSKVLEWTEDADHREEVQEICMKTEALTIYFDSGHTFSQGGIYQVRFRDARFSDWAWARLGGFDADKEKPLVGKKLNIKSIGGVKDKSLFGFVASHWPNYLNKGAAKGWLVCDDGSMESADFIHYDPEAKPPQLSLIHVKGSGSEKKNREISVSDYEIVVGQAIKNLRYLDRVNVAEKLGSETDRKISSAVWLDGVRQKDRRGFLKALDKVRSNVVKKVYVVQPRVRKIAWEKTGAKIAAGDVNKEVRRLQQLDTLLLAARAECLGLGVEFHVIGEDDSA